MYNGWVFLDYEMGNTDVLYEAIDKDRSLLNLRNEYGNTLLTCAIDKKDIKFITYLIVKGVNINGHSKEIDPPLCTALQMESPLSLPIIAILIAAGADIELKGLDGYPLHVAIKTSSLENVKLLVDIGANIEAKREDGETPLWYASFCGDFDIVQYLLRKGANPTIQGGIQMKTPCEVIEDSNFHNKELLLNLFPKCQ